MILGDIFYFNLKVTFWDMYERPTRYLKMSDIEMPDDGQQLNTSLFSNSRPYCFLDREEVNAVRNGVIAPSSEIWGKCLYLMYRPSGGSGEVGDWNQQVWVSESQSPVGQKKARKNETRVSFSMIACFRFETEFHFKYTTGNN